MKETPYMTVQSPLWSQLCDEMLTKELRESLAYDRRTAHLELSIYTDGRVAHVEGEVGWEKGDNTCADCYGDRPTSMPSGISVVARPATDRDRYWLRRQEASGLGL